MVGVAFELRDHTVFYVGEHPALPEAEFAKSGDDAITVCIGVM